MEFWRFVFGKGRNRSVYSFQDWETFVARNMVLSIKTISHRWNSVVEFGTADYVELCRRYKAFVVTDVPRMSFREKDLAHRFIEFIDAVYESKAKIVLTLQVPIGEIFSGEDTVKMEGEGHGHLDSGMRSLMDDLGISMDVFLESSIFVPSHFLFWG
jgi:hypothetical protein